MPASGCECQLVGPISVLVQLTGSMTVSCIWTGQGLPAHHHMHAVEHALTSCLTLVPVLCLQYEDMDGLPRYQPSLLLHSPEVEVSPATF